MRTSFGVVVLAVIIACDNGSAPDQSVGTDASDMPGTPGGSDAGTNTPTDDGGHRPPCEASVSGMFAAGSCDCGDDTCRAHIRRVTATGNTLRFINDCEEEGALVFAGATVSGTFSAGSCDCGDSTCRSHIRNVSATGNTITFTNDCGVSGNITLIGASISGTFTAGQCDCGDDTCQSHLYRGRGLGNAITFENDCAQTSNLTLCGP